MKSSVSWVISMKALVYDGPGAISLADKPKPELQAPSDAVVRVTLTTICGTDRKVCIATSRSRTGCGSSTPWMHAT